METTKTPGAAAEAPLKDDEQKPSEAKAKSIVDSKYRDKYKNRKEWLSDLLKEHGSATREVTKTIKGGEGEPDKQETKTVIDGVDTAKLFKIARENGLNVDKYENQTDTHGFGGRFRMTVGNMLRSIAKQRHGLTINGTWIDAPKDWLEEYKAPTVPSHERDGTKIVRAKVAEGVEGTGQDAARAKATEGKGPKSIPQGASQAEAQQLSEDKSKGVDRGKQNTESEQARDESQYVEQVPASGKKGKKHK